MSGKDGEALLPEGWPRPVGYANGVSVPCGRFITVAGQVGWNPHTLEFESSDLATQTRTALANVLAVLSAGGAEPRHVVRMTWYVTDRQAYLDARTAIGRAWRELFGSHYPAMSLVVVAGLLEALALVEIEATAVVPD
ncbi:MAG TPA: RidA family protein [Candidatus Eisenbacteria bacterium]